jgi:hypothetical protein
MYFIPYDVILHSMYICKKWDFNKIFESWILNNKVRSISRQGLFRSRDFDTSGQKAPLGWILRNILLRIRRTYFRTGHVTDVTSGLVSFPVTWLPVAPHRSSANTNWAVDPVWKWPWPEVCSAHARFSPHFFLSSSTVVTWLSDVSTLYYYSRY